MSLFGVFEAYLSSKKLEQMKEDPLINDIFEYYTERSSEPSQNSFNEQDFFRNKNYDEKQFREFQIYKTYLLERGIKIKHLITYEGISKIIKKKKISSETIDDILSINDFNENLLFNKTEYFNYNAKLKKSAFNLLKTSLKKNLKKYDDTISFDGSEENAVEIMGYLKMLYSSKTEGLPLEIKEKRDLENENEIKQIKKKEKKFFRRIKKSEKKRIKNDEEIVRRYKELGWEDDYIFNMLGHYVGDNRYDLFKNIFQDVKQTIEVI